MPPARPARTCPDRTEPTARLLASSSRVNLVVGSPNRQDTARALSLNLNAGSAKQQAFHLPNRLLRMIIELKSIPCAASFSVLFPRKSTHAVCSAIQFEFDPQSSKEEKKDSTLRSKQLSINSLSILRACSPVASTFARIAVVFTYFQSLWFKAEPAPYGY